MKKGIDYCKDCWPDGWSEAQVSRSRLRKVAEGSGGRCATHWRLEKDRRKAVGHEARVQKVYGLQLGDYGRLYDAQGGRCAFCRRATGKRRKLAVDHDHETGLVRGLLCSVCNQLLGHLRDDPATARRIAEYLEFPPADRLGIRAIHEEKREE